MRHRYDLNPGARVAVCFCFLARLAGAEDRSVARIVWEAPAGCPAGAVVEEELQRSLTKRGLSLPPNMRLATAHVTAKGTGYQLDLQLEPSAGSGHSTLDATDCEELGDAAATITSLAMSAKEVTAETAPPVATFPLVPEAPDAPPPAATPTTVDVTPDVPAVRAARPRPRAGQRNEERVSSRRSRLRLGGAVGLLFDIGTLTRASGGTDVRIAVRLRSASVVSVPPAS